MNRVTAILGTKYPIIQGAMQYVANGKLAAAVSEAGGLGVVAAGGISSEQLITEINIVRKLTQKQFAVNLNLQYKNVPELVKTVIEQGIKIITTGAGTPKYYMDDLKKAGIKVIPVVPNLKIAQKMEKLGVDAVIAEGMEAGAHIGQNSSLVLWPQIVQNLSIPVIAAGGIATRAGVKAAFDLGCEGVQSGTVFSVCSESPVSDQWREAIYQNNNEPATLALGMPAIRVLNTARAQEITQKNLSQAELMNNLNQGFMTAFKDKNVENGVIFAGEDVNLIHQKQSAQQIINELAQGLEK
ncbi:NAD(P)H-dependent flavin oxidoreductase [Lactobacillus helveticus]|uniref:Probable nitronate monooxygenase n=3 Tax=Lactobacillus helveticus TaxID=1587 RepID=A0A9Q5C2R6_LACHE|nr:nitronate monooxygenase [Lactobacillus helveticus]ADX70162.1 Enoyl-[acyl-carrier-protein] reductase (NADH) [Lactobacillus helveticus H10]ALI52536.1 2-nitropropane dioxygenase [Lactobacillus helveticus]NRN72028.1 Nitronate monooxygenase [Lactobacillus helveticus]NRN75193.1 Nitronate monooxygenase [Lactobacillus helveticus]NRN78404.1 Nitronate monooxygenase [Lactobacillus helveticus]